MSTLRSRLDRAAADTTWQRRQHATAPVDAQGLPLGFDYEKFHRIFQEVLGNVSEDGQAKMLANMERVTRWLEERDS